MLIPVFPPFLSIQCDNTVHVLGVLLGRRGPILETLTAPRPEIAPSIFGSD